MSNPLVVKIYRINKNLPLPVQSEDGDWIDLYASETHEFKKGDLYYLPLGIVSELPHGFEAHLAIRSGTPRKKRIVQNNIPGVIDYSYRGYDPETGVYDEWKFNCRALEDTVIKEGDRIAQFRIVLSQFATSEDKKKWLESDGLVIEEIDTLSAKPRGGFGHSGDREIKK